MRKRTLITTISALLCVAALCFAAQFRKEIRVMFTSSGSHTMGSASHVAGLVNVAMTFTNGPQLNAFSLIHTRKGIDTTLLSVDETTMESVIHYFPNPYYLHPGDILTWSNTVSDGAVIQLQIDY